MDNQNFVQQPEDHLPLPMDKQQEQLKAQNLLNPAIDWKAISANHTNFIIEVAAGMKYSSAYRQFVSRNANADTCRTQGSDLAKKYRKQIELQAETIRKGLAETCASELLERIKQNVVSDLEVAEKLTALIRGKAYMSGPMESSVGCHHMLKAIELYVKHGRTLNITGAKELAEFEMIRSGSHKTAQTAFNKNGSLPPGEVGMGAIGDEHEKREMARITKNE